MTNSTFFLIYHDISSNSHYPAELHVITPIYIMRKPQHLSSITTYRICRWLQIYICLSEKVNSARKLKFHTED